MKKIYLSMALAICVQLLFGQAQDKNITIPDLDNYKTLKCDFHMHTVFSDGLVWPTVRIDEAYAEGLDAISITEHLEYRPHKEDIKASHNRSFDIAKTAAEKKGIILIKGSEITRSMAPGHNNAIFLQDCDKLDTPEYMDAFKAAKDQNAFIFWNHPGWDAQQPEETRWWDIHTQLYEGGFMQGIEVANGPEYYPEAHQWCLDKKLTMIGTSDIHQPIQTDINFAKGEHRTITLVFAKERSSESIREALLSHRTAVFYKDMLIGEEVYLKELFKNAVAIEKVDKTDKNVRITLKNNSGLTFRLKKGNHDPALTYFREYTIEPNSLHTLDIRLSESTQSGNVNFEITNLLVKPGKGLDYQISF